MKTFRKTRLHSRQSRPCESWWRRKRPGERRRRNGGFCSSRARVRHRGAAICTPLICLHDFKTLAALGFWRLPYGSALLGPSVSKESVAVLVIAREQSKNKEVPWKEGRERRRDALAAGLTRSLQKNGSV
ncbi:hypothetical protein MTO96_035197 [Rhipicephalus appendiculatus]